MAMYGYNIPNLDWTWRQKNLDEVQNPWQQLLNFVALLTLVEHNDSTQINFELKGVIEVHVYVVRGTEPCSKGQWGSPFFYKSVDILSIGWSWQYLEP